MRFTPGTPQSVIKAAEQAQMNRPKVDKTNPPPAKNFAPGQQETMNRAKEVMMQSRKLTGQYQAQQQAQQEAQKKAMRDMISKRNPAPSSAGPGARPPTGGQLPLPSIPGGGGFRESDPSLARPGPGSAGPGAMPPGMKKGGSVVKASKRADGIAQRGKTKGRYI